MPIHQALLAFLLLSSLSLALADVTPVLDAPTAYEMLERFGFPKGILPEGVQGYLLLPDGGFEVLLRSDCEFKVERGGYLLKYKRRITGRVASGTLTELQGVSVRVLHLWFGIDEVVRRDADLNFYVGPLFASFPAANFKECQQCRSGSDCAAANAAASLLSDS